MSQPMELSRPEPSNHESIHGCNLAIIEDFVFRSPPLEKTYNAIRVPVILRTSGCWFSGDSGQGKSTAITYCLESLRAEFPLMPVFMLNLHMLPTNASRSIPIRLLEEVEHKVKGGETTSIKIRLVNSLAERALRCPLRQIVLLFDEAQALRSQDLFLLKDLSNDLARLGVGMLTVMFGESPKMEDLADRTRSGENVGLAERFFVRRLDLCSYEALDDWQALLTQMDEVRFSELENRTVPEAFLVNAADGAPHLLQTEARGLWKAIEKTNSPSLRRIFTGIRWWILHAGHCLSQKKKVPKGLWESSMAYGACVD